MARVCYLVWVRLQRPPLKEATMRSFASKFLRGFAVLWFILVFLLIFTAVGFEFYRGGFWHGYEKLSEWFSPFNISGWFVNIVTCLPGILAFWVSEKIRPKLKVVSQVTLT